MKAEGSAKPKRKYRKKEKDMPKMKRSGKFSGSKTKKIFDTERMVDEDDDEGGSFRNVKKRLTMSNASDSCSEYNSDDDAAGNGDDSGAKRSKSKSAFEESVLRDTSIA